MASISKTSPGRIKVADRRLAALNMRREGATFESIATAIAVKFSQPAYSKSTAYKDVCAALQEATTTRKNSAEELIALELERLDYYLLKIAGEVRKGNLKAIATAIKINESRRKLLGLDAPVQVQIEQGIQTELRQVVDALEAALPKEVFDQVLDAIVQISDSTDKALSAGLN
jgi:hypothetical protein